MTTHLILNADDFGLTAGINRAIAELHRSGVLPSTTLMANAPAFVDAVAHARTLPQLGVGCHITLVDGAPVSPPATIPSLLGPDRRSLRPSLLDFVQALLRGAISVDEIRREALAQIDKLQQAGIHVTHLDTHKHAHLFPPVHRCLLQVAEQTQVAAIRNPFEAPWSLALEQGSRLRRLQVKLLRHYERNFIHAMHQPDRQVLTTDGSIGIAATGDLDHASLTRILSSMPSGVWELVCHPGYEDADLHAQRTRLRAHREIELRALLSAVPMALASPRPPTLISFTQLAGTRSWHQQKPPAADL